MAWESPSSARHSSSRLGETSSEQQAASKEAADHSLAPPPGAGVVVGSQEGSPHKVQTEAGRQAKELSSYPLQFGQKADTLKHLTDRQRAGASRHTSSAKVSCYSS